MALQQYQNARRSRQEISGQHLYPQPPWLLCVLRRLNFLTRPISIRPILLWLPEMPSSGNTAIPASANHEALAQPRQKRRLQKRHCLAEPGLHALPATQRARAAAQHGVWTRMAIWEAIFQTIIIPCTSPHFDLSYQQPATSSQLCNTNLNSGESKEKGNGNDGICGRPTVVPGLNIGLMYFVQLFI